MKELRAGRLYKQPAEQAMLLAVISEKVIVKEDRAEFLIRPPSIDHPPTVPRSTHVVPPTGCTIGADRIELHHVDMSGAFAFPWQRRTGRKR
jgi:hypothetical protein